MTILRALLRGRKSWPTVSMPGGGRVPQLAIY
jgi:hypothetical protein